jgi:hypothetical protein
MAKSGQARVPTTEEWQRVFEIIQDHRHPEKNTAIMQTSAKLGLRAQEIALLQIKEVARLKKSPPGFTLYKVMTLPAAYTKGANGYRHPLACPWRIANFSNNIRQLVFAAFIDPYYGSVASFVEFQQTTVRRQPTWHQMT